MRKYHNKERNDKLCSYFLKTIFIRYMIPTILLLMPVIVAWFLIIKQAFDTANSYSSMQFIYLMCANILTSIASVSIYHTVKTYRLGFDQINKNKYAVSSLICVEKYKNSGCFYCVLSDGNKYRIYGKSEYNKLQKNQECELIIISNDFGAKIWEFVLPKTIA